MVKIPPWVRKLKGFEKLRRFRNSTRDSYKSWKHLTTSRFKILQESRLVEFIKQDYKLTESQKKELYESIINQNALNIDIENFDDNSPSISIIIINRNGLKHLERLLEDFEEKIQYPHYEIIVVDNASRDKSLDFLEGLSESLPLKLIKNTKNESFSKSNNQAAEIARGDYLLLLNNDVEPTYGWLNQMMKSALQSDDVGAVGAKLVYPDCSASRYNRRNSFKIQHTGIAFREENGFIKPHNIGNGDVFTIDNDENIARAAITAAALLVSKNKFFQVDGLDEGYLYGYEDVDFCLKLLKKGYKNICSSRSLLFHYEFGTQESDRNNEVRKRRLKNRRLFQERWGKWLRRELLLDKLNDNRIFSPKPLKVTFVVTETGENSSAGDYFTALSLGKSFKKFGWEIAYLSRTESEDWYEVDRDVDVLISLLDAYDIRRIRSENNLLIKIAWPRNWLNRWIAHPDFVDFDLVLATSETACRYIEEKTGMKTDLLPLATDPETFNPEVAGNRQWESDYCFTGSYWKDPREIVDMLDPESLPYTFKLFGKNWDEFEKLKDYCEGFVNYHDIPRVYRSTRIVVDDANRVTKEYGSVNSRVFDAIASGVLVVTNGDLGAEETFNGILPVYKSKEELKRLLEFYLSHEEDRKAKIKELQDFVLSQHTYDQRAEKIRECLENYIRKRKMAIKIPAPSWEEVEEWGDYYLALGLKKELERKDCEVVLQVLPEWDGDGDARCDTVLVLRGLSRYQPKPQHFNIMWNISHPDEVTIEEYNQYQHVFIASQFWAEEIAQRVDVPVEVMLQCTDPELFYPDPDDKYKHDLLFVGNSRGVHRKIIKDLLPTEEDLAVYGAGWEGLIDKKYIKGEHIPNKELRKAYSSCKILLCDHWDDMRDKGFLSNRLFDASASGAFIISDKVRGVEDVFGDTVVTYDNPDYLQSLTNYYLINDEKKEESLDRTDLFNFTFEKRVELIIKLMD
ncbi:glycosyl transferase GT2 family [Methanobacterium formicicum]|uniref:Glycosyl transferase GT2 family n=1 Tax=Methanobacterium formicicum TaxID=2162 RepID=A0A089ZGZ8_METFO|nr:glycosyltransferase [Methanobacterium formicicum]AIS31508.1 glycosyl transferase GT2 family [Methanobacterium formicicum]